MKQQIPLHRQSARFLYYRYKDSVYYSVTLLGLIVVVSLLLLFWFIIPEISSWFSIRNEVIATNQKLNILQNNITTMQNIDSSLLNSQMSIAASALPVQQDPAAILSAISTAALLSHVSLNDFNFQLDTPDNSSGQQEAGATPIQLVVSVNGSVSDVKQFLGQLSEEVPVVEVVSIDQEGQTATITLHFYEKPFPAFHFTPETPIAPLSDTQLLLLQNLSVWQQKTAETQIAPSASASAVPLFE